MIARIDDVSQFPKPGPMSAEAREREDLDFKRFADKGKMEDHATDVAAAANADLGGVIVVGADIESDPNKLSYPGVKGQTVADVKTIYEKAALMCQPPALVDVFPLTFPDGVTVVVVNVSPSIDQPLAAPFKKDGWRFPVRRGGSHGDVIEPKDLPMFMNRQIRSAFLRLSQVPADKRFQVKFLSPKYVDVTGLRMETTVYTLKLEVYPLPRNVLGIWNGNRQCRVPLSDVIDVWEDDKWTVKLAGHLTINHDQPLYTKIY
jgi:hypothetical protein